MLYVYPSVHLSMLTYSENNLAWEEDSCSTWILTLHLSYSTCPKLHDSGGHTNCFHTTHFNNILPSTPKSKYSPKYDMQAEGKGSRDTALRGWGVEIQLCSILTSALDGGKSSTPRPGCLTPWIDGQYPSQSWLVWPRGRSGSVRKTSPPPGFDSRTVQFLT
jgi:hypothetical protein